MSKKKILSGGNKKKQSRKPKTPRTKVLAEYKAFKGMFRKWADQIKLDWEGNEPFTPGAKYRFILPSAMVNFVVALVQRSHTGHDPGIMERQVIEETVKLREAIEAGAREKVGESSDFESGQDDCGIRDRRTFRGGPEEIV